MEINKKTILVPWDFTDVAANALEYAVRISRQVSHEIVLINVVKKEKEAESVAVKLKNVADEVSKKHKLTVRSLVKEGSIFSTISDVANDIGSIFVIMGTHGIKGMQKLTGSWALKVIASSKVPFIVVQGPPSHEQFRKIVIPIDFTRENKEKLRWADYISRYFKSKVFLYVSNVAPSQEDLKRTRTNLSFAKKYLEDKQIDFEISATPEKGSFADHVLKYALDINADLIMIMTTSEVGIVSYVFAPAEQAIIANNSKIPVMCINPRTDVKKYGGFH
jgi:nucleotide-binding universal stress UspA family protein